MALGEAVRQRQVGCSNPMGMVISAVEIENVFVQTNGVPRLATNGLQGWSTAAAAFVLMQCLGPRRWNWKASSGGLEASPPPPVPQEVQSVVDARNLTPLPSIAGASYSTPVLPRRLPGLDRHLPAPDSSNLQIINLLLTTRPHFTYVLFITESPFFSCNFATRISNFYCA